MNEEELVDKMREGIANTARIGQTIGELWMSVLTSMMER